MRFSAFKFRRNFRLAGVLAGMLFVSGIAGRSLAAQNGRFRAAFQQRRAAAAAQRQAAKPAPNGAMKPAPNLRRMAELPPKWVESMRNMTPEEQQRFMQNDARFNNLPPQRQEQIRRNLQNWNKLTPEQQQEDRRREAALERMTPEQRQYFLNVVGPKYQALPPDRKQLVNRHLNVLGHMTPETQQAALNDPKFMEDLSPGEQDVVRNLNSLRNAEPPPTPTQ